MDISDQTATPITAGQLDYIAVLEQIRVSVNKMIGEVYAAQEGEVDLDTKLDLIESTFSGLLGDYVLAAGLAADLSAGGYKITGAADAVGSTDLTTLQQVSALISGGGSPGSIGITALGVGAAAALEAIRINAAGDGVEGVAIYTQAQVDSLLAGKQLLIDKNRKLAQAGL